VEVLHHVSAAVAVPDAAVVAVADLNRDRAGVAACHRDRRYVHLQARERHDVRAVVALDEILAGFQRSGLVHRQRAAHRGLELADAGEVQIELVAVRGAQPRAAEQALHLIAHEIVDAHLALAKQHRRLIREPVAASGHRLVRGARAELGRATHTRVAVRDTRATQPAAVFARVEVQRVAAARVELAADAMIDRFTRRLGATACALDRRTTRGEALQRSARMAVAVVVVAHVDVVHDEQAVRVIEQLVERSARERRFVERAGRGRPEALRLHLCAERAVLRARNAVRLAEEDRVGRVASGVLSFRGRAPEALEQG
jgi:hypothetical protein